MFFRLSEREVHPEKLSFAGAKAVAQGLIFSHNDIEAYGAAAIYSGK
jgi:hypothetical protein